MCYNDLNKTQWFLSRLKFLDQAVLYLENGNLTGTIPQEIYNGCPHLGSLGLIKQNLSGTLSTDIGKLTDLSLLWLVDNNFNGTIPIELGNLKFLRK